MKESFLCMELKGRLAAIASKVPKCETLFDIGTDHAYLPIFLIQEHICNHAVACDVRSGPLRIAKKNIAKHGFQNNIDIVLSDGLSSVAPTKRDVIVIAGMGGMLIADILDASKDKVDSAACIILQANTAIVTLREWLYSNSFEISDETLCKEDRRIYNIIIAKLAPGNDATSNNKKCSKDFFVGQKLIDNANPLAEEYFERMIRKYQKVARGLEKSAKFSGTQINIPEVEYFIEALAELRRRNIDGNI